MPKTLSEAGTGLDPAPALAAVDRDRARHLAESLDRVARSAALSNDAADRALVANAAAFLARLGGTQPAGSSPDAIVFAGSDPRLQSVIGTRRGDEIEFEVPAGLPQRILFGPYIPVSPGRYRIELAIAVRRTAPGQMIVDLCHHRGNRELYSRPCLADELRSGLIGISYAMDKNIEDLEVRLTAPAGFAGSVRSLSIRRTA